jgi:acyl dehydratase
MTTIFKTPHELLEAVGKPLGHSEWLLIDQPRINLFADATGDHQWIHVDPVKAKMVHSVRASHTAISRCL